MSRYERANAKSGRLFVTEQQKLADNPKLPVLNGTIVVDGIALYLGLWKRKAKSGLEYFTAELTYPNDEEARLKATGPGTSAASKKEAQYDREHHRSVEHDKSRWESRGSERKEEQEPDSGELPF